MSNDKLLPCRCGGEAKLKKVVGSVDPTIEHKYYVKCRTCGKFLAVFDTKEPAIKQWNEHSEPTWNARVAAPVPTSGAVEVARAIVEQCTVTDPETDTFGAIDQPKAAAIIQQAMDGAAELTAAKVRELANRRGKSFLTTQPPAADGKLREALVKIYTIYCAKVKAEYGKLYRRKGGTLKPEEARYLDLIAEVGTICEAALAQPASDKNQ